MGWIFLTILILLNVYVWHSDTMALRPWVYNNPLLIVASIAFFMLFGTFRISNKWINCCASSVLAAYLLPEAFYVRRAVTGLIGGRDVSCKGNHCMYIVGNICVIDMCGDR